MDAATRAFRLFSRRKQYEFNRSKSFEPGFAVSEEFLWRLGGRLEYRDKSVLDVGCGMGQTCIYLVEHGAREALGVEINAEAVEFGNRQIEQRGLGDRVRLRLIEDVSEVDGTFDVILSQNSFEHIMYPERMIDELCARLKPNGQLAIGFGRMWNSPRGGHMANNMTWLPWGHLVFPERVFIAEQNRFYPPELHGRMGGSFAEYGLNQLGFRRFRDKMASTGLRQEHFAVNVHRKRWRTLSFNALRRIPGALEYFTFNCYGVWRKPG